MIFCKGTGKQQQKESLIKTVWTMKKEKLFRKNDILFAAAVLLTAVVVYLAVNGIFGTQGGAVQVIKDGEVYAEYPLAEDVEVQIDYGQEQGINVLVIENGKASVTEADCPDRLCVKQKEISKNGESIVCLPHKLVIFVVGGEEAEYDGFTR